MGIINESGLYSLILTSRKPEAKKFKKWVTSEVLPSIRKTGCYAAPGAQLEQARQIVVLDPAWEFIFNQTGPFHASDVARSTERGIGYVKAVLKDLDARDCLVKKGGDRRDPLY